MMAEITARIRLDKDVQLDVSPDAIGAIFAGLDDDQQVAVLAAMVEHMAAHPLQWDYIIIRLEAPENERALTTLQDIFRRDNNG
jgi:hypothetical protein